MDLLAAKEGLEPPKTESESVVLPLHYLAIYSVVLSGTVYIIADNVSFVNSFYAIYLLRKDREASESL